MYAHGMTVREIQGFLLEQYTIRHRGLSGVHQFSGR